MNSFERRNRIIEMVENSGEVSVAELSKLFDTSGVTIRSDLRLLEKKGLLVRFHGGAVQAKNYPIDNVSSISETHLEERYNQSMDSKQRIARRAASMVNKDDTVILDSGSTTMLVAKELVKTGNITVITNNLAAAGILADNKDITLVMCGGTLRHKTKSLHGVIAEQSLAGVSADIMFVGADGIDPDNGITTFNEGYSISNVMAQCARKIVVTIDSSKFGRKGFNRVLPIEQIDAIITDTDISESDKCAFEDKHIVIYRV